MGYCCAGWQTVLHLALFVSLTPARSHARSFAHNTAAAAGDADAEGSWQHSTQAQLAKALQSGRTFPLHARHGVRERGLLRNGTLGILGAIREVGYFYTTLQLGTPPRNFSMIIDTGSTVTYVPCQGCKHCGKHQAAAFDPGQSSTSLRLPCGHEKCNCGSPACLCSEKQCYYSRTYAEKSSSEGWMVEDACGFPDDQAPFRLVFGCENGETGEIYKQAADGILGMGNNDNAFQSQLVAQGVIPDIFGLCFGFPSGGTMTLGEVELRPDAVTLYTPLSSNRHLHYYNVQLDAIAVDDSTLPLEQAGFEVGYGSVLDSGTTFTYLPSAAFSAFVASVDAYVLSRGLQRTEGADPLYHDICWKNGPENVEELEPSFPRAELIFSGGMRLQLVPYRYLFVMRLGQYCLGMFDNGNSGTLIGGISVRNVLVQYDRRNQRVGFTEAKCENIWSASDETASDPSSSSPSSHGASSWIAGGQLDSDQRVTQVISAVMVLVCISVIGFIAYKAYLNSVFLLGCIHSPQYRLLAPSTAGSTAAVAGEAGGGIELKQVSRQDAG